MTTLEFLQSRASIPAKFLSEPAPTQEQLKQILTAAVSAPDHGVVRPWEFIVISGDARRKLGDLFAESARKREPDLSAEKIERQREKPMRSPMIVTVVANISEKHPKAPRIEQILSAGAAAQQILLAANALGFGSIWLTGANAFDESIKAALGIAAKNQIIGFLYLGTSKIPKPGISRPDSADFTRHWDG